MRLRIVDAFTERPFSGNAAGVCLLEGRDWPADDWMQHVAAELNLPMTAFVRRRDGGGPGAWALRWFNPVLEEHLCGHATLATAHALHSDERGAGTYSFETRSGELGARVREDGTITLDFPLASITEIAVPDGLAEALGAEPVEAWETGQLGDVLVVLGDEGAVRALAPDLAALDRLGRDHGVRGFTVTARAAEAGGDHDFVSRFFAPHLGLPEDAVTGSAHTALAPYWARRFGRTALVGLQVSARTGVIGTEIVGDRVHLSGRAVTVLDGTLRVGEGAAGDAVPPPPITSAT